jgi:hypothetical protein
MFTLEQKFFIVQCYFRNGEKLENGEWSYSTPRVFEELTGLNQQLAQKVYKCLNMFSCTFPEIYNRESGI